MTRATIKEVSLYQRVHHWRKRKAIADKSDDVAASPAVQLPLLLVSSVASPALQLPSSLAMSAVKLSLLSLDAQINSRLDNLRPWMKRADARKSLMRRARKSPTQVHLSRLIEKCNKTYYGDRYKGAFKAATLKMQMPDFAPAVWKF